MGRTRRSSRIWLFGGFLLLVLFFAVRLALGLVPLIIVVVLLIAIVTALVGWLARVL